MDPKRLKRHSQLWEKGTASVRRAAIGGSVFALLVLLKVVEPYHTIIDEMESNVAELQARQQTNEAQLGELSTLYDELDSIDDAIRASPWDSEIEDLMQFFREGRANREDPQQKADTTIRNIAASMRRNIVEPLQAATDNPRVPAEIREYPQRIENDIANWQSTYVGNTNWYATVGNKEVTVERVKTLLQENSADAKLVVDNMREEIGGRIRSIEKELSSIPNQIIAMRAQIKSALDQILPAWAKGLVSERSMVVLYPWVLVAIAMYLVINAVIATQHFRGMAEGEGWTSEEQCDPLLSSPWTLTWRGLAGTTVTLAFYVAALGTLTYCLYRSLNPGGTQAAADGVVPVDASVAISTNLPVGLAYALLLAAAAVVVFIPWRDRRKLTGNAGTDTGPA